MNQEELAEHIRELDKIKARYDKGDGLFGPLVVYTLLKEIALLSERIQEMKETPMKKNKFKTPVGEKETVYLVQKDLETIARRSGQPLEELTEALRLMKVMDILDRPLSYTVKED